MTERGIMGWRCPCINIKGKGRTADLDDYLFLFLLPYCTGSVGVGRVNIS